jgi:hypothetical protein
MMISVEEVSSFECVNSTVPNAVAQEQLRAGQIIAPRENGEFGANHAIQTMVQEKPPGPKLTL